MTAAQQTGPDKGRAKLSEEVVRELEDIYDDKGELLEEDVLLAARDPKSAMHDHFEWNNSKAAEAYRLEQARHLIRSVTIKVTTIDGQERSRRVYASQYDPESAEPMHGFRRAVDLEQDLGPDFLDRTMKREWKGFFGRWGDRPGFWAMVDEARPKPKRERKAS
jgi:hypothetical protein